MWAGSGQEALNYVKFMDDVKSGKEVSLEEMGKLNNLKKEALTEYIFEKDKEATKYVNTVMD